MYAKAITAWNEINAIGGTVEKGDMVGEAVNATVYQALTIIERCFAHPYSWGITCTLCGEYRSHDIHAKGPLGHAGDMVSPGLSRRERLPDFSIEGGVMDSTRSEGAATAVEEPTKTEDPANTEGAAQSDQPEPETGEGRKPPEDEDPGKAEEDKPESEGSGE